MNGHAIFFYVAIGLLALLTGYLLFRALNMTRRIARINQFLRGDMFSKEFHAVIANYFAHHANVDVLLEHVMPAIHAETSGLWTALRMGSRHVKKEEHAEEEVPEEEEKEVTEAADESGKGE